MAKVTERKRKAAAAGAPKRPRGRPPKRIVVRRDPYGRREAIMSFMEATGLKIFPWSQASDLSNNVLHNFLRGASETLTDTTYEKLAAGAAALLQRPVAAGEIRGETSRQSSPRPGWWPIKIASRAGAGATVIPIPGDHAIEEDAIPALAPEDEWIVVEGNSQWPRYDPRDLILVRDDSKAPPEAGLNQECVVQLKDGRRLIKRVLAGTMSGRFTLWSHNAPPEVDVEIEWVTPFRRRAIIAW